MTQTYEDTGTLVATMITDEDIRKLARDAWLDIEYVWEKATSMRGARRKIALNDVKELMICKLEGVHMWRRHSTEQLRYELLQVEENHPLYAQKEVLLSSLEDAHDKLYAKKIEILDLKKQILCLQEEYPEAGADCDKSTQTTANYR